MSLEFESPKLPYGIGSDKSEETALFNADFRPAVVRERTIPQPGQ